jgi:carboxymethylenebutenolidase
MTDSAVIESGDGHTFEAHFARPSGAPRGALVVVQEIFGANGHIRSVCDEFAADGWVAVAPSLFDRVERKVDLDYGPDDMVEGRSLRGQVSLEDSLSDIAAVADAAAVEVGSIQKVGIVGYCWGGSLAAAASVYLGHMFGAAVGYYGGQVVDLLEMKPEVPLMLHFGELDAGIPLEDVARISAEWPEVPVTIHLGAGHGFNCDRRPSHHLEAATAARAATLGFFTEHLG